MIHKSALFVGASTILLVFITSCARMPLDSEVVMTSNVIDAALLKQSTNSGSLMVKRDIGGEQPSKCVVRVKLDGRDVADIGQGEGVLTYPTTGDHVLGIAATQFSCPVDAATTVSIKQGQKSSYRVMYQKYVGFVLQPAVQ